MPDTIVKEVRAVFTAESGAQPGIDAFERSIDKMRADVEKPILIGGGPDAIQKEVDRQVRIMELGAQKMAEAQAKASLQRQAREVLFGPEVPIVESLSQAGKAGGEAMAEATEKSFLDELNESFGRGSVAGSLARLLRGSGPLLAIRLGARELRSFSEAAEKVADEFRRGDVDSGEMVDRLARSVPILGDIYSAGRSIREILTGEGAAIARINEEAKDSAKQFEIQRDMLKEGAEFATKIQGIVESFGEPKNKFASASERLAADVSAEKERQTAEFIKGSHGQEISDLQLKQKDEFASAGKYRIASFVSAGSLAGITEKLRGAALESAREDEDRINQLMAEDRNNAKLHAQEMKKDDTEAKTAQKAIDQAASDNSVKEQVIADNKRRESVIEANKDLSRSRIEFDEARLKAAGKNLDAEILIIKDRAKAEKEIIDQNTAEKIAKGGDISYIEFIGGEQKKLADAKMWAGISKAQIDDNDTKIRKQEESTRKQQEADRKKAENLRHQDEIEKHLQDFRVEELKSVGHISDSQKKRLEVAEQFLNKKQDLDRILHDENSTANQKKEATDLLISLPGDEQAAAQEALRRTRRGTATAQEGSSSLRGYASESEEQAKDPMIETAKNMKVNAEQTKRAADLLNDILTRLKESPITVLAVK